MIAGGELPRIRNLGKKTQNEIKTRLLALGYEQLSDVEKRQFLTITAKQNAEGEQANAGIR